MAVFLDLNGHGLDATIDEQERLMLDLAGGLVPRDALTAWLRRHVAAV
jgi:prophage maintenance system killer protein